MFVFMHRARHGSRLQGTSEDTPGSISGALRSLCSRGAHARLAVFDAAYFFVAAAVAPTALTVALVAAATLASAMSATCLAALFMLSKAEVAAATADLTALTATSDPGGAFLVPSRGGRPSASGSR